MAASSDASQAAAGKAVEMISFHSVSKGFIGECGIRGGYFELYNIDDAVKQNLYKLASISLCSNTHGQVSYCYKPLPIYKLLHWLMLKIVLCPAHNPSAAVCWATY